MRKSTIAIGIAAALSTQAFVTTTNADAAVKVKPLKSSPNTSHALPHYVFPHHSPNGGGVLYDQSGSAVNGAPSQNFESSFDQYDAQGADDFVVTDASGWTVSAFNFEVSLSTSPPGDPTTATYDIEVYADDGGFPGASAVCSYPSLPGTLDGSQTALSVTLDAPCALATGTYWVSMVVNLDFAVGGQMFWSDFTGGTGANSKWQNPGGGFGVGCTSWSDLADCGVGGSQNAFIFQVLGTVGGGGGSCGAGQLCLEATVGTDTSAGACATTDTIDATVGDELNFCYTITNNTGIELDYHTLTNNVDGTLFTLLNQPVPAGGTFQYNNIETVTATATYNSTWTAQDVPPGYSSEVTGGGGGGCPDRIFSDGFEGTPIPCGGGGGFIDITGTGTPLNNGDDQAIAVTMPFSFNFYGTTSNQICVDNNGFILFNTTACPSFGLFTNVSLPASSLSAPAMMPMWDDFDSESGNIYTDTRGTAPNRQFIVEWFDRVHYSGSTNTDGATFELILNEDGTIQFEYSDVEFTGGQESADCSNGACATIGLQNDQTLYNQFSAFEPSVTDNSGILWTGTDPQVFVGTDSVTVNVGAPNIVVNNGNPITGSVGEGETTTIPVPIQNTGDRDLDWTINEAGPADRHFPQGPARTAKPLGDVSKATLAPAPLALRHPHKGGSHPQHAPNGVFTVPVFASDIYNNNYETFDALVPGATTTIAPTNGDAFVGGAFIDGDFSKQYVIIGQFGAGDFDEFGSVDTATGAFTSIGSASNNLGEGYSGMSWDPVSGQLYAVSAACGSSSHLWTIDPATGTPTAVAEITGVPCAIAIAINSAGQMYAIDIVNDALFAVDKSTGSSALVGSIGFNANYAQDAAFDLSTDILYYAGFDGSAFTDQIYTVDLTSGLATPVGNIGSGVQEVDAMSIATAGGPCSQPQDLPWLSFNPTSGTTAPGDTTNVSMGVDGTGSVDGDVLAGTMCTVSNDPDTRTVETSVTINVTTGGGGGGNVIDSGIVNYAINPDFTGIYINWLTGCTITSDGGSCPEGTNFNAWSADGTTMSLFWSGTNVNMCVSTGGVCDVIHTGGTVGPASTFSEGSATGFAAGADACLGFQFVNADTSAVNYGVVHLTTTTGGGFPATLVEYWYDNSGAAITAPAGCN